MLTIGQRPFQPDDRSQAGHWEGDLIIGKDQGSAIGTLVERQTRMVRLLHLPRRDGDALHDTLKARMAGLPPALLRSITWDQGTEMARHRTITPVTGRAGLLLRLPLALAARLEREHERPAARPLPQGHRPEHPLPGAPAGRRKRAQQPAPARPERPGTSRTIRRAASLRESVCVATLTRTCHAVRGSRFKCR